jgi:hypothetical protein
MPLRRRATRSLVGVGCGGALLFNTACYSYRPIDTATGFTPRQRVAVDVTDQARVRLGEQLGSGVSRIEGTVVAHEGEQYVLSVSRVGYVGGTTTNWAGENVRVARADVARVQERRLSGVRTGLLAGGIAAALVVLTLGMDWIGFGSDDDRRPDPGNGDPDQ